MNQLYKPNVRVYPEKGAALSTAKYIQKYYQLNGLGTPPYSVSTVNKK